jgi:hypothetical protein
VAVELEDEVAVKVDSAVAVACEAREAAGALVGMESKVIAGVIVEVPLPLIRLLEVGLIEPEGVGVASVLDVLLPDREAKPEAPLEGVDAPEAEERKVAPAVPVSVGAACAVFSGVTLEVPVVEPVLVALELIAPL